MLSAYLRRMDPDLTRIRGIADYQFGPGSGAALFPGDIKIERSRNTGKIRLITLNDTLLASLRPNDGLFTLTIAGAERLVSGAEVRDSMVTVLDDMAEYISKGRNVMAKHVVEAGDGVRPGDEVIVLDSKKRVLAVGRALLNCEEMLAFGIGVAVRTRRGKDRNG
jgi:7-cyano-7-deazaguanine tRNA-ribosyltransferase